MTNKRSECCQFEEGHSRACPNFVEPPMPDLSPEKNEGKEKCLNCGKEMTMVVDPITKKESKYLWHCSCMPEGVNLAMGGEKEKCIRDGKGNHNWGHEGRCEVVEEEKRIYEATFGRGKIDCDGIDSFIRDHIKGKTNCKYEELFIQEILDKFNEK